MTDLTNLEICKFITLLGLKEKFPNAKGIEFDDTQNCFWVDNVGFTSWPLLNPLTDDALCFQLMVKYGVSVDFIRPLEVNIGGGDCVGFRGKPNKAICLAIIEAHKES